MSEKSFYTVFKTTAGWVAILGSAAGLKRVTLPQPSQSEALAALEVDGAAPNKTHFKTTVQRFIDYFNGKNIEFTDKLDLSEATAFQRAVWETTKHIPCGQTRSYSWVAKQTGKAGAARAVGQALGKNKLPIIIPCHRVLSSDGKLGGFSGGLVMKKRLLALEKKKGN
jgi:methylated-DNA-[protein]-cysteine S-methyltransferase